MFADDDPFWFVSSELLTSVFHIEIDVVARLLAAHPGMHKWLDAPEATVEERTASFVLLAHRKIVEMIDDKFVARYENSPSINDIELNAIKSTYGLVVADAPAWVLEMQQVVEQLPFRISTFLPEPLRMGGYNPENAEQMQAIESAKATLRTIEQIQILIERVIDQQLTRLKSRWPTSIPQVVHVVQAEGVLKGPKTRNKQRTRNKEGMRRDKQIFEIDDAAETPTEFLKLMDERKVKPQPTWIGWPHSWVKAYQDAHFRKLIQQDKSRAIARFLRQS